MSHVTSLLVRGMGRVTAGSCLAIVLLSSGCHKDAAKDKKSDEKATASSDDKTATAKAPPDPGIDVPTEEDFEEAVEQQITPESDLNKELDKLDKEISE
jgi:hypothetical protein